MLEEPAEHAPYADAVAQAGQAWTEGAHATHEQVDPSTRLGCRIELVDDLDVGQAVDLDPDPGLVPVTVAAAIGLDLGGGVVTAQRVSQSLAGRRLVVVLTLAST